MAGEEEDSGGEDGEGDGGGRAQDDDTAAAADAEGEGEGEGEAEEEQDGDADVAYGSPDGVVLRRQVASAEETEAEVRAVQGMWEMAAVLDFLHLFRRQLKLQRQFAAGELERVLVTSPGDGGVLADVHIVSWRVAADAS